MATMSFNYYQNGKYGTLPHNGQKDVEITEDMHLKMSKKIAQLTKVIYELNTRNDEHESAIQNLRDQHEEQMQQLIAETKEKIQKYRIKLSSDVDHKKQIDSLHAVIEEQEKARKDALNKIEEFKKSAGDEECRLKTEHSKSILTMSQEILTAKQNFEDQLKKFESWKHDMEENLREVERKHEAEVYDIRNHVRNQNDDWLNEKVKLQEKFKLQIEALENERERLKEEKLRMSEEYELKLNKAQTFFEKEMSAMRESQNSSMEGEIQKLKEREEKLKKDFSFQESELKKHVDSLINKLSLSEETVDSLKAQLDKLNCLLEDRDSNSSSLQQQLQDAKLEASDAVSRLKQLETELISSKEKCSTQATELLKKSTAIGELEASKLQQNSMIKDLQAEIDKLQDRLSWLESERKSLENKTQSLSEQQSSQFKAMEKALEDASIEKRQMKERYEKNLESYKDTAEAATRDLNSIHASELDQLHEHYKSLINEEKHSSEDKLSQLKKELEENLARESDRLSAEKSSMKAEFDRIKTELSSKLQSTEEEVKRLDKLVKESENGLGSASVHIDSLKDETRRLQSELDKTCGDLNASQSHAANLQAELEKLRLLHQNKIEEFQVELKTKLDQLASELESKWTDNLRKESRKLREEITQQKEDEKKAALNELSRLKDEEIVASRSGWESKVNELLNQISRLKKNLQNSESKSSDELESLKKSTTEEISRLQEELQKVELAYTQQIDSLNLSHNEELTKLLQSKDIELSKELEILKANHIEDIQAQTISHKAAMDDAKQQSKKQLESELADVKTKHMTDLDNLKSEISQKHCEELERKMKEHGQEMQAARMEIDRAIEISKQKDRDHNIRIEDLQAEIAHRERHINNLDEEIRKLQASINELTNEIDMKSKEVSKVKADANHTIKKHDSKLKKELHVQLNNMTADHLREKQNMLTEFNTAQEILKDKIAQLEVELEESEENYRNRDSRPEDLELIEQLRDAVAEREMRMKQLIDEKRYYQLELVNRETNFNKVFNSGGPNVGVLNPLAPKKKKSGDKSVPSRFISAPTLNGSRLEHIPGSPIHDEKLNPVQPLPQPQFTKKFVK